MIVAAHSLARVVGLGRFGFRFVVSWPPRRPGPLGPPLLSVPSPRSAPSKPHQATLAHSLTVTRGHQVVDRRIKYHGRLTKSRGRRKGDAVDSPLYAVINSIRVHSIRPSINQESEHTSDLTTQPQPRTSFPFATICSPAPHFRTWDRETTPGSCENCVSASFYSVRDEARRG